jgi:hypothetical protein
MFVKIEKMLHFVFNRAPLIGTPQLPGALVNHFGDFYSFGKKRSNGITRKI